MKKNVFCILTVIFMLWGLAQANEKQATAEILSPEECVHIGDFVELKVTNMKMPVKDKLAVYLNRIPMEEMEIESVLRKNDSTSIVIIAMNRQKSDKYEDDIKAWQYVYQNPWKMSKKISIGISNGEKYAETKVTFIMARKWYVIVALILLGLIIAGFLTLAVKSNILRNNFDPTIEGFNEEMVQYSLARTQLAFWSILIIGAWLIIMVVTGEPPVLPESALILLAISIGTTAGAKIVDINQAEKYQTTGHEGFFIDIIKDKNGVSIHRFQMVIWTLVLGIYFVIKVVTRLEIVDFDNELLALMGISNGTYLGIKVPENKKV